MGKKSAPSPTPVYVNPPDNSVEMGLLQQQIAEAQRQSELQASISKQALEESRRQADLMQKQFEEQLALQEEMFKAPKDMELGTAPTNTDFKTFTPSTPDVKQPGGLEGTRLGTTTTNTRPTTPSRIKLKDPLGLGLTGINFGLNT